MQKLILLSAVAYFLCACSEQACDPTGERYTKMMNEGSPLTEKDKACLQAVILKSVEDIRPKTTPRLTEGERK